MCNSNSPEIDALCDAIVTLESKEECARFLEDALTQKEIIDIAQRYKAARMLRDGYSYAAVCKETGMSTATISRVSKALENGRGGYHLVLERTDTLERND
ncbi:MAG: helix-turn-helix domain-containing protein [Clostridia bacterium]|nr:helix-turn-helix domain-containing protein [Clostridia bacterium]MBO5206432.1 helix-turn-helix domain-containing protein [Clostridia bacterium]